MGHRLVITTISLVVAVTALGQMRPPDEDRPVRNRDFIGTACIHTPEAPGARMEVFLRFAKDALVALRAPENAPGAPFRRLGELTIEALDSTGTSHARATERIEIPEQRAEETEIALDWIERHYSLPLPPGRYTTRIELVDLQSQNRIRSALPPRECATRQGGFSATPLFFYKGHGPVTAGDTLVPQNFGNGILFSTPGGLALQLRGLDSTIRIVNAVFALRIEDDDDNPVWRRDTARALPLLQGLTLRRLSGVGYTLAADTLLSDSPILLLPLRLEMLPLRRYMLDVTLTAGQSSVQIQHRFPVYWPDQPMSLRDVDYAIETLRLVASEGRIDSIRSGDFFRRRNSLEAFWASKDATPETADNPLMTEFYRRVDFARSAFATLKQADGTRTDRGKIHILYGPPASTDRVLDPKGGYTETWTYSRTKKQFVFQDRSRSGDYVLVTPTTP